MAEVISEKKIKKKQLKIARRIVEHGGCKGICCEGCWNCQKVSCPLLHNGCEGYHEIPGIVFSAKVYIETNSKNSKKELLERIKKLEEKVKELEAVNVKVNQ